MVVKKVMRWSPWAPPQYKKKEKKKKKKKLFKVNLTVTRFEGLPSPPFLEGEKVAVSIRPKGWARKRWKRGNDVITAEGAVRAAGGGGSGIVDFGTDKRFETICRFGESSASGQSAASFAVYHGMKDELGEQKKVKKLDEIGKKSVNLADWIQDGVEEKEFQPQVRRQSIPISLLRDGSTTEAILHVDVSFVELRTSEETLETPEAARPTAVDEDDSSRGEEGETSDDSCKFESGPVNDVKLENLLSLSGKSGDEVVLQYKNKILPASTNSSNSAGSSPDQQLRSSSRRGMFFSWGKGRRTNNKSTDYDKEKTVQEFTQPTSNGNMNIAESQAVPEEDEDPIGKWEEKVIISRDKQTSLKIQTFFASIDQRDASAGGESACTALVALIADELHLRRDYTPSRSEFDSLIREGSLEWQKLCSDASYIDRFPNRHFDLDTILKAKIRPIVVLQEKSFVGFFQPESFESLHGAMSFDDIWNKVTSDVGGGEARIYIVSWNDHFFVLKLESDAYYIIDTLGERLIEGCTKAYMLKFDDNTEMCQLLSEEGEKGENNDEAICRGKECCREFIKRFLAAIPLREELEVEEKGTGNANTSLHQRLQIEFHLTKPSDLLIGD